MKFPEHRPGAFWRRSPVGQTASLAEFDRLIYYRHSPDVWIKNRQVAVSGATPLLFTEVPSVKTSTCLTRMALI
jgi:hypothetical protein